MEEDFLIGLDGDEVRQECRMIRWMEAYEGGLTAKAAQIQVKKFSSRQYKSHRRVPDAVTALFNA